MKKNVDLYAKTGILKRFTQIVLISAGSLALACAKEDDAVTSQRSAIESFLDSRGWEYAEASGVYRYTINADRPEYESEPQIAYGDSVVFDFAAYLFSGSVSATEVPYYTNIRSLVEGDTVLNTEYWSFEPQRVVLGATPMIRGLTYGLQGAARATRFSCSSPRIWLTAAGIRASWTAIRRRDGLSISKK